MKEEIKVIELSNQTRNCKRCSYFKGYSKKQNEFNFCEKYMKSISDIKNCYKVVRHGGHTKSQLQYENLKENRIPTYSEKLAEGFDMLSDNYSEEDKY
ncbi:MAG: hypothetical protein DRH79_07040 [Candidatus Cloacimonadota bacterium]|nr:MAG: hypothetical protein DRH79_07040 [Candidatus Cloacimonadota bacterium]